MQGPDHITAADVAEIATAAAAEAGGVPVDLLGDFPSVLAEGVHRAETVTAAQLRVCRRAGTDAARRGVALRALLDLYLNAARLLWHRLPAVTDGQRDPAGVVAAGEIMLRAAHDVVAALTEGHQLARRSMIRAQESARREFVDDLLTGSADVAGLLHRAAGFGMDLSGPHAVVTAHAEHDFDDGTPLLASLERAVLGRKGDAHALVASKDGRLVVVFAAPDRAAIEHVVDQVGHTLSTTRAHGSIGTWRLALGRAATGADGVLASYRDTRDAHHLADLLDLPERVVEAADLRAYRLLLHDRAALSDLVDTTLGPLRGSRAGADTLVATLAAYFDVGGNVSATARALHLSVRAVTYRLQRVRELTGLDPDAPAHRYTLQTAALGAQLLGRPQQMHIAHPAD